MAKLVLGKNKTIVVPAIVKTVGGITPSGTINITSNGVHDVTNYASASVNVPNGTETKTITQNGTYTPTSPNIGFSSVTVNVPSDAPVINSLNVTPTTSAQTITPSSGVDGFAPVNVAAVTSSIDANIVAGNIKNGVEILGVTGNYTGVSTIGWIPRRQIGTTLFQSADLPDLTGITTLESYCFYNSFAHMGSFATNVDWSGLTELKDYALYNAFSYNRGIGSINLSGLIEVGDYALSSAFTQSTLQSANFSSLVKAGSHALSSAFSNSDIISITFSNLSDIAAEAVLSYAFNSCDSITQIYFVALTSSSFGSYITQFNGMLSGVTGCTVHFPSNLQSTISGLYSYPNFGGTNTTLLFDLPGTS